MQKVIIVREDGSRRVAYDFTGDVSLAKQSFQKECDINLVMRKYEKTGLISHVNANKAMYADVSEVPDYPAAMTIVRQADLMFMSLPSKVRARFENDPAKYLQFVSDPANKEELISMGLVEKPKPVPVPPVDPVLEPVVVP